MLCTGEDCSETWGCVLELRPASVQQAWDLAQNFGYVAPTEHLSTVLKTILLWQVTVITKWCVGLLFFFHWVMMKLFWGWYQVDLLNMATRFFFSPYQNISMPNLNFCMAWTCLFFLFFRLNWFFNFCPFNFCDIVKYYFSTYEKSHYLVIYHKMASTVVSAVDLYGSLFLFYILFVVPCVPWPVHKNLNMSFKTDLRIMLVWGY